MTKNVPLPVSLTLYNLYVPNISSSSSSSSSSSCSSDSTTTRTTSKRNTSLFRSTKYAADLLPPVTLQIVYRTTTTTTTEEEDRQQNNNNDTDDDNELAILYSQRSVPPCTTIHPTWYHLDEQLQSALRQDEITTSTTTTTTMTHNNSNNNSNNMIVIDDDVYQGLYCKLIVRTDYDTDGDDNDNDNDNDNDRTVTARRTVSSPIRLVTDILPLHPSKLRRLTQVQVQSQEQVHYATTNHHFNEYEYEQPRFNHNNNNNDRKEVMSTKRSDGNDNDDDDNDGASCMLWMSPTELSLPVNTIVVQYSDGTYRMGPSVHRLLVEKNILNEQTIRCHQHERYQIPRFDDDVFRTLDVKYDNHDNENKKEEKKKDKQSTVTSAAVVLPSCRHHHRTTTTTTRTTASLLELDDESKAVPVQTLMKTTTAVAVAATATTRDDDNHNDDNTDILLLQDKQDEEWMESNVSTHSPMVTNDMFGPSGSSREEYNNNNNDDEELEFVIDNLRREKEHLSRLIAKEEASLRAELETLREDEIYLKKLMDRVHKVDEETKLIRNDTVEMRQKLYELDFVLEAQRIKLLDELRMIYPIRCQAEQTWVIRGQEIPSNLHSGAVSEDEISAGLGFLCHSIVMVGKYLSVALRYRIICNSSRSAVQQDATTILPLFQARALERDELDRAMALLDRNVSCILKTRGIRYKQDDHILGKVNRIYESIVDGR